VRQTWPERDKNQANGSLRVDHKGRPLGNSHSRFATPNNGRNEPSASFSRENGVSGPQRVSWHGCAIIAPPAPLGRCPDVSGHRRDARGVSSFGR
jgi:hypothetical protein